MAYGMTETGQQIYERTYSRTKPDGSKETWPETVRRVVDGNLGLVDAKHTYPGERADLIEAIESFKIMPAGRHLWASGVKGRQYLMNCWVAPWPEDIAEHFSFTFLRLMEGGGVGSNYSNRFLERYGSWVTGLYKMHIVCDPSHPDYADLADAGVLSDAYSHEWEGAYQVEDAREGWAAVLTDIIHTYGRKAKNVNRVYDVSRVRRSGAPLRTFGGVASGPLPFARMMHTVAQCLNSAWVTGSVSGLRAMEIDHAIAECVVAGGNRRSARMAIMRWDDPEISGFLECKADTGEHWTTNISVEVDDLFFQHLSELRPKATAVARAIASGMLANGEPGIWNSSLSNEGEPNEVVCTNPCGEIVLEPYEPCNLGHVNLGAFGHDGRFDIFKAHGLMTRFLIRATYGDVTDPNSRAVLDRNRRIGVGHFGFAAWLAKQGVRYSDSPASGVPGVFADWAHDVESNAQAYAHELRIPVPVKTRTMAPTGTIAKMPGTTEGIHPIFARYFIRRVRFSTVDADQLRQIESYRRAGFTVEPCQYASNTAVVEIPTKDILFDECESKFGRDVAEELVQSTEDLSLDDMLRVQTMYQECWADNAVSCTVNVDPNRYTVGDLVLAIKRYGPRLKGMTVFPELSRPQSPYERITEDEYNAAVARTVGDSVDEECSSGACPIK